MPLSEPVARRHLHTRTVVIEGFAREDGLWDLEGRMTDAKTYAFPNQDRGVIAAGEPLHDMRVRLTIDSEMRVHSVEASTEASNTVKMSCRQLLEDVPVVGADGVGREDDLPPRAFQGSISVVGLRSDP